MDPEQQSKFAIHEAAREGRTAAVESFINANPRLATQRDEDERLPIHWAVSYNHIPVVELLVSRKDFDPDVQDASGWTPLMIAASLRDGDDLVDILLGKEADVNAKSRSSPCHTDEATKLRRIKKGYGVSDADVTLLLCTDYSGQTALHFTASKNNIETARKLISHGATARVKDKRGQLPLHRAAAIGSVPMVNLMLEKKSPLNATDISGLTALHHAISEGHGDTALVLLKAGAETDKRDVDGNLAIDLAPDKKIRQFILHSAEREGVDIEESK